MTMSHLKDKDFRSWLKATLLTLQQHAPDPHRKQNIQCKSSFSKHLKKLINMKSSPQSIRSLTV